MKSKSSIPCTARGCIPLFPVNSRSYNVVDREREKKNSLDKASCLGVEESMLFEGGEEARGRVEAGDVVVGGRSAVGGSDRRHLEYMCCSVLELSTK